MRLKIGGGSRGDRRLWHQAIGRSQRNTNTLTHHQTSASKTYVMINTVILSSIFDYLYLLFYCELEPQILCVHKNRSREKNAKIDGIGD